MKISKDHKFLDVEDYLATHETFVIYKNDEYEMLVTDAPEQEKIGRYYDSQNYISHTDSKKTILDVAYQFVKEKSLKKKVALLTRFQNKKGKLLDIGAGTGDFLNVAKSEKWEVLGVEPNENARKLAIDKKVNLVQTLDEVDHKSFAVITMWHVLEHVHDLEGQLTFLKNNLNKDGVLFIAVPNFKSFDAEHYGKFWAAYDAPRHLWHFSQTSISKLFAEHQMKVVDTLPMIFDSFYVSILSEKYRSGKTMYWQSFLLGLKSNRSARASGEYSSLIYVIKHV